MYASMKRRLVLSPSTVSGSTCSRPGSSKSCERSRSGSYIGCGKCGAAAIVSIPTGALAGVSTGNVAFAPVATTARVSAVKVIRGCNEFTIAARSSSTRTGTGTVSMIERPGFTRCRCSLAAARKSRAAALSAVGGSACNGGVVTGWPSAATRKSGRPRMLKTASRVTAPKAAMFALAGRRCRTVLTVASVDVGSVMKVTPETPPIFPIHVAVVERFTPCAFTRRVSGPRTRPMRLIALLVALTGSAVDAIRATTVFATGSVGVVVRRRPNAGAATRIMASGARPEKCFACIVLPTTRLNCNRRRR